MASHRYVLGQRVDIVDYNAVVDQVIAWTAENRGRYVCVSNVHMVMESHDDSSFRDVVNGADMVTPDGRPLVVALQLKGEAEATQVRGPDLMPMLLAEAERRHVSVGFLGSAPATLASLTSKVSERHPGLEIAFAHSPPFRTASAAEDQEVVNSINRSGAGIVFVGLGCPKQERWMATHRDRIRAVLVGTGAAFDVLAGTKPEAPRWMQRTALEWAFRLAVEPRRLWRRYLWHSPRFVVLLGKEILRSRIR